MVTYSFVAPQTLKIQFVYMFRATILVRVVFRKYFKCCCWHKRDIIRVVTNHIGKPTLKNAVNRTSRKLNVFIGILVRKEKPKVVKKIFINSLIVVNFFVLQSKQIKHFDTYLRPLDS